MTQTSGKHCDHEGCRCSADSPDAVIRNGHQFCCDACANGEGCDHPGCNCGQQQTAPEQRMESDVQPPIFPVSAIPR